MARGLEDFSTKDNEVAGLFDLELQFFNQNYARANVKDADDDTVKDGLDNAKTIKDSLEKFIKRYFKVPKWLEGILNILNEILGILKTFVS